MASARQRGQRWAGLYRDADGRQRSAGTFGTEKEALKAAEAQRGASKRGKVTVAGHVPGWSRTSCWKRPRGRRTGAQPPAS
jgi:hypothetical protein